MSAGNLLTGRATRTAVTFAVAGLLASFALVASPLAMPARAASYEAFDVASFNDAIQSADGDEAVVIEITADIEFPESYVPPLVLATNDVTFAGGGHTLSCAVALTCESWLLRPEVYGGGDIIIENVTVTGFKQAVFVREANLTVRDAVFTGNGTVGQYGPDEVLGGAIHVANAQSSTGDGWTLRDTVIENTVFENNAIEIEAGIVLGGALYVEGDLEVYGGAFIDNSVEVTGEYNVVGGGGVYVQRGQSVFDGVTFSGNEVRGEIDFNRSEPMLDGGGVLVYEGDSSFTNVEFTGNSAPGWGGGLLVNDAYVVIEGVLATENSAAFGGALYANIATANVSSSEFSDNVAGDSGGGLYFKNSVSEIAYSTIAYNRNESGYGGGLAFDGYGGNYYTYGLVRSSAIYGNEGRNGGGLDVYETTLEVFNSTIAENTSVQGWAAHFEDASGHFENVTIARNAARGSASSDVQRAQVFATDNSSVDVVNTVIAEPGAGGVNCRVSDSGIHSLGYNAVSDTSCGLDRITDGVHSVEALDLGPLQFNGGLTWTILPWPESVLVDAIPVDDCTPDAAYGQDQRGVYRPVMQGCDIGAVEILAPVVFEGGVLGEGVKVRILNAVGGTTEGVALKDAAVAPPAGVSFPYPGVGANIFVNDGWPADIEYFTPAPSNQLWKLFGGEWVQPSNASKKDMNGGTRWRFRVTDGGFGDNDGQVNGEIVDPFAAGIAAAFTG